MNALIILLFLLHRQVISCLVVNILSVHTFRYEYICTCTYMHMYSFYVLTLMENKGALIGVSKEVSYRLFSVSA